MPTIVVEDGSNVANANSYVDLAYLSSYAEKRGLTLPQTQTDKEIFLLRAMDYLEVRRSDWQGVKSESDQPLQWPRKGVEIDCEAFPADAIPVELKNAQCQLVVEQQKRTPLFPKPRTSSSEGYVTEKTIGPLTKKFAYGGAGAAPMNRPIEIPTVEVFLSPLTNAGKCCGTSGYLQTIRL